MTEIAVLLLAHKENKDEGSEITASASKRMKDQWLKKQEREMAKIRAKKDAWEALPVEEKIATLKQRYAD